MSKEKWVREFWAERSEFWQDTLKLQRAAATASIVDRSAEQEGTDLPSGPRLLSAVEIACLPWRERERIGVEAGWTQVAAGRWVKRYGPPPAEKLGVAPAYIGTAMTFANGRSRWVHDDWSSDFGDKGSIPDLQGSSVKEWCERHGHPYVDGKGPASFGDRKTLERCLRETGHHVYDRGGARKRDTLDDAKDDYKRKWGVAYKPPEDATVMTDDQVEGMFET